MLSKLSSVYNANQRTTQVVINTASIYIRLTSTKYSHVATVGLPRIMRVRDLFRVQSRIYVILTRHLVCRSSALDDLADIANMIHACRLMTFHAKSARYAERGP